MFSGNFDIQIFGSKIIKKFNLGIKRDRQLSKLITPYLENTDCVLDIGLGLGRIAKMIKDRGHRVVGVDIKNLSIVDDIVPVIYDGRKLPFKDNSFDVSLLITVLHHTPNPELVLREAKRVSKKIIIIEDIYRNNFQKQFTYFMDSLLNFEFFGHPHSNKSDLGWVNLFKKLRLKLINSKYIKTWMFSQGVYFLEKYVKE